MRGFIALQFHAPRMYYLFRFFRLRVGFVIRVVKITTELPNWRSRQSEGTAMAFSFGGRCRKPDGRELREREFLQDSTVAMLDWTHARNAYPSRRTRTKTDTVVGLFNQVVQAPLLLVHLPSVVQHLASEQALQLLAVFPLADLGLQHRVRHLLSDRT